MADQVEVALSSVAEGLESPSWADMVEQADNLTAKGKLPPPREEGGPSSKHSQVPKKEGKKPSGFGYQRGPSGKKAWKGKSKEAAPTDAPASSSQKGPERMSISSRLSQAIESEGPVAPGLPSELEEDLETLSQVTSVHDEKIEALQEEVTKAHTRIKELEEDQKAIMMDFSSIRHELTQVKALLSSDIQTPPKPSSRVTESTVGARGKETLPAPASSGTQPPSSSVAKLPSWKHRKA